MIIEDIKDILKKYEYNVTSDTMNRIQTMLESIRDDIKLTNLITLLSGLIKKEKNQI